MIGHGPSTRAAWRRRPLRICALVAASAGLLACAGARAPLDPADLGSDPQRAAIDEESASAPLGQSAASLDAPTPPPVEPAPTEPSSEPAATQPPLAEPTLADPIRAQPTPNAAAQPDPAAAAPASTVPAPAPLLRLQQVAGRDWFVVDRPGDALDLRILPGEVLDYDVEIDVGVGEIDAGDVQLAAGRSELLSSLPDARDPGATLEKVEVAWVRSTAKGAHFGYELRHTLETRFLPGPSPRLVHKDEQRGSENRNRESKLLADADGQWIEFRADTHCGGCPSREHMVKGLFSWQDPSHCRKCKRLEHRVWEQPKRLGAPEDALDMLGAVWVARNMVKSGVQRSVFPIVDRHRLWEVTASIGAPSVVAVPAGRFDCRPVSLGTRLLRAAPGDKPNANFQGLFGLQGSLRIWLEARTGTPVLIEGDLPIPVPLVDSLRVRVQLKAAAGADPEFRKLP